MDLLLRAIPYVTFAQVVGFSPKAAADSSLSKDDLPFEDQYNAAIIEVLQRLGYAADSSHNKEVGKVDIFVNIDNRTFGVECIMAKRGPTDHENHRGRFDTALYAYSNADHKALVTIGSSKSRARLENESRWCRDHRLGAQYRAHWLQHSVPRFGCQPTRLLFEFQLSIASPKAFCDLEDSQRLECGKELNRPSPWRCPSCRGCRFGGVLCRVRPRGTCVGHKQQDPLHPEGFAHQQTCATSRQHFRSHWRKDLLRKSGRKLCFIHCRVSAWNNHH